MFNLHQLNQHLTDLKYDLASQALASSQTLIGSFRSLVISLVTKIINEDALIKGQVNGPENFKAKIVDGCLDLANIKDEYTRSLKMVSEELVTPIIMTGDELSVPSADLIANTRFSARLPNSQSILNEANVISFIRQPGLARPVKDDIYGINSFPECVFAPVMTNSFSPAYTAMYQANQVPNINNMQTQHFYRPLNSNVFSRPIWFSIKPIVLSSPNIEGTVADNVVMSKVDKLTADTFEAMNCYYCQATEYQSTGSSSYIIQHSTMILYTMVQARYDDIEHPTFARIAYKWYRDNGVSSNNTITYYARRNAANGICESKINFDGYDIVSPSEFVFSLGSGFYSWGADRILKLFTNLCQGDAGNDRQFQEVLPSTIINPVDVKALYNDGELVITKGLTRTDDGYAINDIHVSMADFMGNLSSVMQNLIDDLSSAEYE